MVIKYHFAAFIKSRGPLKIVTALVSCCLFFVLVRPIRFNSQYSYIADEVIEGYLIPFRESDSGTCAILPNLSLDVKYIDTNANYNDSVLALQRHVNLGGWWSPDGCEAVHHVAIVVPYRNRKEQLAIFLKYMHEYLQSQLISYRIFVIDQAPGKAFNRGKLMNVGFKEALKLQAFPCFIFHDVDLIPQVEKNIYACTELPRHMSASINVWRYNLLYDGAFGGAISVTTDQFRRINGFSNVYFGWGAEDDDILKRIRSVGLDFIRFSPWISRYFMLPHKLEVKNPERLTLLSVSEDRNKDDGLNSLEYDVISYQTRPLFTHIVVQL